MEISKGENKRRGAITQLLLEELPEHLQNCWNQFSLEGSFESGNVLYISVVELSRARK